MQPTAIIITQGMLTGHSAKTAHGLLRTSDRFRILGVIDPLHAGKNARQLIGEETGHIPVFASIREAHEGVGEKIDYAIVGVAPKGGKLPEAMKKVLEECLEAGISLVSGLHEFLGDIPSLSRLAKEKGLTITDIRKPVDRQQLHFWTGAILQVTCPIVAVLGMETNIGKRTTAKMLKDTCRHHGIAAEMVFTGQTGWLQDGGYGFVLDTTVNDFVGGELEYWILKCIAEKHPEVIFLEGQSGLRNPSGPCGSELLLSGGAKYVVLVFSPKRRFFGDNNPSWGEIPNVESEIELIKVYGSKVIGLVLNTQDCLPEEVARYQEEYRKKTGLPVVCPLENGVEEFLPMIRALLPGVTR